MTETAPRSPLLCGFCQKTSDEVRLFFATVGDAGICSECVGVMMNVLAQQHSDYFDELVVQARANKPLPTPL